ncbi:MAG: translation elongation factor Ts [Coriobacteriales bacterium]|jgi:elongation factor Ts|nr:translation elongation factor Ts [Coriobacteriales bacterium]MDO5708800.1 translation elongation factor Ts [Coriobacteriales bacterium]
MAKVTAALVKQLREMTDSPMMECKKALVEAEGDIEKAVDVLRTMGLAKAIKRAGRDTNEGTIAAYITEDGKVGALVELTCETDFVGTNAKFRAFAMDLAKVVAECNPADLDAFMACPMNGNTVDAELKENIHVFGENQKVNRFARIETDGALVSYIHHDGKHADIVEFAIGKPETAASDAFQTFGRDVAMQVIAMNPISAKREDIPEDVVEHEKSIYRAQAAESGRPEKFWDGIINGRLKKFYQESTLTEQAFVKDSNMTVAELAEKVSKDLDDDIKVVTFIRFNFGE